MLGYIEPEDMMDLMNLLAKDADLQDLINKSTSVMNNPLVLVDTNFHILAASTQLAPTNNILWDSTITKTFISDQLIDQMEKEHILGSLRSVDEPIRGSIPEGYECIRVPLYSRGRYRGFLGVYDYHQSFREGDADRMKQLGKIFCISILHNNFFNSVKGSIYDLYLYELLNAKDLNDGRRIHDKYSALSMGDVKVLYVFGFKGQKAGEKDLPTDRLKMRLNMIIPTNYSVEYEGFLTVILPLDGLTKNMTDSLPRLIEHFCEENNVIAGISMKFHETQRIFQFYKQARFALDRGNQADPDRIIFYHSDYIANQIVMSSRENLPNDFFIHPAIRQLIDYDEKYSTDYAYTLKIYLDTFCSLNQTAKDLFLHYNSIKYRIAMIQKITGIDLKDTRLRYLLYISFLYVDENSLKKS